MQHLIKIKYSVRQECLYKWLCQCWDKNWRWACCLQLSQPCPRLLQTMVWHGVTLVHHHNIAHHCYMQRDLCLKFTEHTFSTLLLWWELFVLIKHIGAQQPHNDKLQVNSQYSINHTIIVISSRKHEFCQCQTSFDLLFGETRLFNVTFCCRVI